VVCFSGDIIINDLVKKLPQNYKAYEEFNDKLETNNGKIYPRAR